MTMEEYSVFCFQPRDRDILLTQPLTVGWREERRRREEGGMGWTRFVGRCHQAERVPRGWQRPAALLLLPTQRRWRDFSTGFQTRAALISHFIHGCEEARQNPWAWTGRLSTAFLIMTELQKVGIDSHSTFSTILTLIRRYSE